MGKAQAEAFEEVLAKEREALLRGDLETVLRLAARKERLAAGLGASSDPLVLTRLQAALARNSDLLAAASEGISSAIQRLRALANPPPLATYDGRGQRQMLEPQTHELARRS